MRVKSDHKHKSANHKDACKMSIIKLKVNRGERKIEVGPLLNSHPHNFENWLFNGGWPSNRGTI